MTITVEADEAKARLSGLLAKVEAGEEVIIARGEEPVARLTRIRRQSDVRAAIEEIRAARAKAKPVTIDEILAWRQEGHRH
ncbi:type II toxin-antitoxin system Phd/YefM family antitoxin [Labrys wisconsinensis]|uniref:Prevent-host-death family protein n=1 Tax=Labrys wisconsinensis TaxID=425677 RepID=A0ABU0J6X6_9HYPH|nr:type II toxin-antitoxin system prevent-host-death family antitoxin [Labrys wisconsinensis]MDQ0469034.1 prevent-host-death family protein [Labrys wisconsinensis]